MTESLETLGVNTNGALEPITTVVCITKSGAKISIETPLTPEDVMTLWNSHKLLIKIPVGQRSYSVIKKSGVVFLHTFLTATAN